ncbi:MAG: hypothetical protein IJ710_01325 [Prevotella sp.]|nr:hypothetical protein [Prevotella sp.]
MAAELVYKGGWQWGDTILQRLEGPIGDGEVWYPNGDHFKGAFHLSYASINGPAYAADGRYEFADGSYIEQAWINTSKDRKPEWWGLRGLFRIHHPEGPDSIAMFLRGGKRYGFELFLGEKPRVIAWYAGEEMACELEVTDYAIEGPKEDCMTLTLTLRNGTDEYRVRQQGGDWEQNNYDTYIYKLTTRGYVWLPNGDSIDHYGSGVRLFQPYDGYLTTHCAATGKKRSERWENGEQKEAEAWEYDTAAAEQLRLPHPFGGEEQLDAKLWPDGHLVYGYDQWVYDGPLADRRPEGRGVLVGNSYGTRGRRYEGEFRNGRCEGQGTFVNEEAGLRQEGQWVAGVYQEAEAAETPIVLHAHYGHRSWSISSSGDWEYEDSDVPAQLGRLGFTGFRDIEIARIERHCITLTQGRHTHLLTPGGQLHFSAEIEGREWSDGCVYDGDDYSLDLTWKE